MAEEPDREHRRLLRDHRIPLITVIVLTLVAYAGCCPRGKQFIARFVLGVEVDLVPSLATLRVVDRPPALFQRKDISLGRKTTLQL